MIRMRTPIVGRLSVALSLSLLAGSTQAQVREWVSGIGSWNDAANWSAPNVPDSPGESALKMCIRDSDTTDCDGSGEPDAVEIASGLAQDENGNGVPDSCDIAAGAIDCDGNGFIDAYEISPFVRTNSFPIGGLGNATPVSWTLSGLPDAVGDVTIEVVGFGDYSASDEFVVIDLDGGEWSQSFFISHPGDCYAPHETESGVIDEATFNALLDGPGIEIDMIGTATVNPTLCGLETAATIKLTYRTLNPALDTDGNGELDVCQQTCFARCV